MRYTVARTNGGPRVVIDRGSGHAVITTWTSLRDAFLGGLLDGADGVGAVEVDVAELDLAPAAGVVGKVLCVGHNYTQHILEMGHGLPDHPNVFSKYPEALVGPFDDIALSEESQAWDWEGELALVIGKAARNVTEAEAPSHIAGYTVANDISARDWQRRSTQWLLGKTFAATTPLGPWFVSSDEVDPDAGLALTCSVDGDVKQASTTSDLLFKPAFLVSYLSRVLTLEPGDVVLTGTPAGVGAAREPAEFLRPGQEVVTEIEGVGRLSNKCVAAAGIG
ncbi:2-hydroxyhepta-2,4-diene-1,7-dioate isomerase [Nocardioides aromaticivorans]|uniref:2-hydroxyhepta-2,4-diene-1,7-dioate isomerase n=1 Tax=Nocardioides aromaticivorans TaxID=200618 RepID=A0ABX7PSQ4_9ACTN|nr:fumarylacetoacetate hydrolase family protein [Nocardioides aromaticivorans]QSR28797.1 2-hydroxyhepta-2,4-diene-1,7-dioate isomerase [Nocardioides aromaticivorans]